MTERDGEEVALLDGTCWKGVSAERLDVDVVREAKPAVDEDEGSKSEPQVSPQSEDVFSFRLR